MPTVYQGSRRALLGGSGGFTLDLMGLTASAAYSMRKLRAGYSGPCMRVRRSSDNAEQDIAFTASGNFDQTAYDAFMGGVNLVQRSQEFDNAYWTKGNCTITADATTAPDSTSTADAVVPANGTFSVEINRSGLMPAIGGIYTISVYLKAGNAGSNWVELTANNMNSTTCRGWVNVSTGATGTNSGWTTLTSTSVGNGWYRYTVTAKVTSNAPTIFFSPRPSDGSTGSVTGDGVGIWFYIWGAQVQYGSAASAYEVRTSTSASSGFAASLYDQSGNGYTLSQSTAAQQPRVVPLQINQRPYLYGDGSDDVIATSGDAPLANPGTSSMTIAAAILENPAGFNVVTGKSTNLAGNNFRAFSSGAPAVVLYYGPDAGGNYSATSSYTAQTLTSVIWGRNTTTGQSFTASSGSITTFTQTVTQNITNTTSLALFNSEAGSNTYAWPGMIPEMILFATYALSSTQIAFIYQSQKTYWGTA